MAKLQSQRELSVSEEDVGKLAEENLKSCRSLHKALISVAMAIFIFSAASDTRYQDAESELLALRSLYWNEFEKYATKLVVDVISKSYFVEVVKDEAKKQSLNINIDLNACYNFFGEEFRRPYFVRSGIPFWLNMPISEPQNTLREYYKFLNSKIKAATTNVIIECRDRIECNNKD